MATNKPINISNKIWAALGDVEAPSDGKMETGWAAEVPKAQIENWVQNRQDSFNAHVNERGIAEWDSSTDYLAGKSLVQGSDGVVYRCVLASGPTTSAKDPVTNVITGFWEKAFFNDSEGSSLDTRISSVESSVTQKQDTLVSGTNIKTVNGEPILGAGDLLVGGESNTASNVGAGVGIFKEKVGVDLSFKRLRSLSPTLSINEEVNDITFEILANASDVVVFPAVPDIPLPAEYPTPTIGYVSSTRELLYSDGSVWNILAVSGTYSGSGSDPYFANVSLLLHMTGVQGSTAFVDSSSM